MKVYYIDPQSYNNLSLYDYSLLNNVNGHELTYYHSDQYQLDKLPGSLQRCRFHYNTKKNAISKAFSYTCSIVSVFFDVLKEHPDVVHIQWIRLWCIDYIFAWLLLRFGVRVIFTAHNVLPHVAKPSDEVHFRKYYRLVSDIIVHNSRTKDELIDHMGVVQDKIHVIFHGVMDSGIAQSDIDRRCEELKKELAISDSDVVFSCLGVQKAYKGTTDVIDVWSKSSLSNNKNARLLIIGRNHGLDYSPVASFHNVYIKDEMISDLDFEAYLQLSSVVLLPYRNISQSGLLFSAVNRYSLSLVTDVGGLAEPLKYGKVGWNIGKPDKEVLCREMLRLAESKQEIDAMKSDKSQFDKVRSMYSWKEIGSMTSALYNCVCEG